MPLTTAGLSSSFGFGDRLGLATPGHLAALTGTEFFPVFAQQSVRENLRTGRTPQQVLDDARSALDAAGWDGTWGADADHLKSPGDLPPFVAAGYTFFTVDPGEYVDPAADSAPLSILQEKIHPEVWEELCGRYFEEGMDPIISMEEGSLLRAAVKYSGAVDHAERMHSRLSDLADHFDLEISVDETDSPTTPAEHFFIANELLHRGVRFTSLAPRFPGRFEKGVDYIGDLQELDASLAQHAAVTRHFGTYKISLHSGSDKFSVYPLLTRHWGGRIHVKTAGTSYLEALRVAAAKEPALFSRIYSLARTRYMEERRSYHVSASLEKLPTELIPTGLPPAELLDDFHARQVLHVTYGSVLDAMGEELKNALRKHEDAYLEGLQRHFRRHLELLT